MSIPNNEEWVNFENNIKNWVSLDNKLKNLNEQTKKIRSEKNKTLNKITHYLNRNQNLLNSQINLSNERFCFENYKWTQPLTFKFLNDCLIDVLESEEEVKFLMNFIKKKRETKYYLDIKRISN